MSLHHYKLCCVLIIEGIQEKIDSAFAQNIKMSSEQDAFSRYCFAIPPFLLLPHSPTQKKKPK